MIIFSSFNRFALLTTLCFAPARARVTPFKTKLGTPDVYKTRESSRAELMILCTYRRCDNVYLRLM